MQPKIFNFPQETLLRLGLNLKEILLLDYIEQFISSGNMRSKRLDGKWYFKLTYKKIIEICQYLVLRKDKLEIS